MSDDWIRASEIAEYLYCRRSWWLRRAQGAPSAHEPQQRAGTVYHGQHAAVTGRARRAQRLAYGLLALTGLVLLAWLTAA